MYLYSLQIKGDSNKKKILSIVANEGFIYWLTRWQVMWWFTRQWAAQVMQSYWRNVILLSTSSSCLYSIGCCCHAFNIDPTTEIILLRASRVRHTKRRLSPCVLNNTHISFRSVVFHQTSQPCASYLGGSVVESRSWDPLSWLRISKFS
jgi:hypothetical protein